MRSDVKIRELNRLLKRRMQSALKRSIDNSIANDQQGISPKILKGCLKKSKKNALFHAKNIQKELGWSNAMMDNYIGSYFSKNLKRVANPIYGTNGKRRGSTIEGNDGEAIIFDGDFSQLSVNDVRDRGGFLLGDNSNFANTQAGLNVFNDWFTLPGRPDFDGVITENEADNWRIVGSGISLYADISKMNFKSSNLSVQDFPKGVNMQTVNFFKNINIHIFKKHVIHRPSSDNTLSWVYGTLQVALLDRNSGSVTIQGVTSGTHIDKHDYGIEGTLGGANKGQNFFIFGYGKGAIHLTTPSMRTQLMKTRPFEF